MKKTFTLLLLCSVAVSSFGQAFIGGNSANIITSETFFPHTAAAAASGINDTLGLEDFLLATPSVYGLSTGYATGMSHSVDTFNVPGLGDVVATTQFHGFSEGYLVNDDYSLLGAMFFAGVVDGASGTNPTITVTAQLIQPNKAISDPATVQSPDIPGPGTTLATANVALNDVAIDPNGTVLLPTFVEFSSTPFVDADFCVTVGIENIYAGTPMDTIAIVSTADGEGDGEYTYHRISQSASIGSAVIWVPTSAAIQTSPGSGADINFAIFPIVTEFVGIEEAAFFNGVKMTTFPNPALSSDNVTIQYAVEKAVSNVDINIYDMSGKQVFNAALGAKTSGVYNLNVPVGALSAGSYIYSIQADGARMAKKMEVLK